VTATTRGAGGAPAAPRTGRRTRAGAALGVALALGLGVAAAAAKAQDAAGPSLLPDLDQVAPARATVVTRGSGARRRHLLGFDSEAANVGAGALVVDARRAGGPGGSGGTMATRQLLEDAAGIAVPAGPAGTLRYTRSPDHQHWHLLAFQRYELRRADDRRRVGRDRKTGFCLTDLRRSRARLPAGTRPRRRFVDQCGAEQPELTALRVGISPGFGDRYERNLEGQEIDVTRVPAGRYVLVHRVNPDGVLREARTDNNAASVLLRLERRPGRTPRVRVLARCPASERCPDPAPGRG